MHHKLHIFFALSLFCAVFLTSCSSYLSNNFAPQTLEEKKIQATRNIQVIKDNKVQTMFFATFLNDIEHRFYSNLLYFFVEITDANYEQVNLARFAFDIKDKEGKKHTPNYIKEISPNEFDEIFAPVNKWSQCYLIAFDKSNYIDEKNLRLEVIIDDEAYELDFSFYVLPFSII